MWRRKTKGLDLQLLLTFCLPNFWDPSITLLSYKRTLAAYEPSTSLKNYEYKKETVGIGEKKTKFCIRILENSTPFVFLGVR